MLVDFRWVRRMRSAAPVVTIDGPVGTGKGTISQALANALKFHILDSGALYRILAHTALQQSVALHDTNGLVNLSKSIDVHFIPGAPAQPVGVIVDGIDVTDAIRTEDCGNAASKLAPISEVREALLAMQRAFRRPPGLVADGRDMGTVVFPEAEAKIFLTASAEARAERRHKQLIGKGIGVNLADLLTQINERDKRDQERTTAPLKPAEDAIVIDTTLLSIDAVVDAVMQVVIDRGLGSN